MSLGDTFAESSTKGLLTRGALAWLLVTPAVAAAKIWWSGVAALVVGIAGVVVYTAVARRFIHQRRGRSRRY